MNKEKNCLQFFHIPNIRSENFASKLPVTNNIPYNYAQHGNVGNKTSSNSHNTLRGNINPIRTRRELSLVFWHMTNDIHIVK